MHALSSRHGELSDEHLCETGDRSCDHCSVDSRNVLDLCDERGLEIGVGPHGGTEGKLPYEVRACQRVTIVHASRYDETVCKVYVIKTCCPTSIENHKFQDDDQMQWVKAWCIALGNDCTR